MRTIQNLLKTKGNINVYLSSKAVCDLFLQNAEKEGFVFRDGRKPTESPYNDLIAVHRDFTIGHHGFVGHEAFRLKGKMKPIVPTVWIDYANYLAGDRRYVIRRDRSCHISGARCR